MADGLTILKGKLEASFQPLDIEGDWMLEAEAQRGWDQIRASFPELIGLQGQAFWDHPKRPDYLARRDWLTVIFPALVGAWAGSPRPTVDELRQSYRHELMSCAREVLRLNPDLTELDAVLNPRPASAEDQEAPDPNA